MPVCMSRALRACGGFRQGFGGWGVGVPVGKGSRLTYAHSEGLDVGIIIAHGVWAKGLHNPCHLRGAPQCLARGGNQKRLHNP